MKKLLISLAFAAVSLPAFSQKKPDGELRALVQAVCQLRSSGAKEAVKQTLLANEHWTPMNETRGAREGECKPGEATRFELNAMLSAIGRERKYVTTHGDMLNGEDPRYDYSLYEHAVYAGQTVTYTLKGREGRQWFVIVPYQENGIKEASLQVDGEAPRLFQSGENGTLVLYLNTPKLQRNQTLTLKVSGGASNQSFVILNHNSRK